MSQTDIPGLRYTAQLLTNFSPESHVVEEGINKLKGDFESQQRKKEHPGENGRASDDRPMAAEEKKGLTKLGRSDIPLLPFFFPRTTFISDHHHIMASREGINPLRPYYIPPSGLSPASNAPAEVASPSSAQVFGSTAREFMPDLDYADYLEASPSVSDWARDALNRALVRYTKVLTAQPFDVAKTILQVYVVPDAAEEQWDRNSMPGTEGSSYDSVRRLLSKANIWL